MTQYFKPQRNHSTPVLGDVLQVSIPWVAGIGRFGVMLSQLIEKQQTKSTENFKLLFMTDAHNKYVS